MVRDMRATHNGGFSRRTGENAVLIRSLAVIAFVIAMLPLSLPIATAAVSRPTCENFLNQADAQAAYNADTSDPLGLASKSSTGSPCEGNIAFVHRKSGRSRPESGTDDPSPERPPGQPSTGQENPH